MIFVSISPIRQWSHFSVHSSDVRKFCEHSLRSEIKQIITRCIINFKWFNLFWDKMFDTQMFVMLPWNMNSKLVGHDELTVLHCNCNLTDDVAIDNDSFALLILWLLCWCFLSILDRVVVVAGSTACICSAWSGTTTGRCCCETGIWADTQFFLAPFLLLSKLIHDSF